MADQIKGSYSKKTGTFTISGLTDNSKNNITVVNSETSKLSTADGLYDGYGTDVTSINASTFGKALNIVGDKTATKLEAITGGKGADTITAITGKSGQNLDITTGAGKDVIVLTSDTGTITISDYAAGSDAIRLTGTITNSTAAFAAAPTAAEVDASGNVKLTIQDKEINLTGAKDKKITIQNGSGVTIIDQPYMRGDLILTNANSGTIASSNAEVINASAKTKAFKLTAEGYNEGTQYVTLGKGNDTVDIVSSGVEVTGGNGNDYFIIHTDTTITDFTLGEVGKKGDRLVLGEGIITVSSSGTADSFAEITFSDTKVDGGLFTVQLGSKAVWNQIKPAEAKAQVIIVDGGTEKGYTLMDNDLYVPAKITDKTKTSFTLGTGDYALAATGDKHKPKISFEATSNALNVDAPNIGSETGSDLIFGNITGGSGKDTLSGADTGTGKVVATTIFSKDNIVLNGGKGNDLLIGNVSGADLYGGAGNDTLRSGAKDATVRAAVAAAGGTYGAADYHGEAGNDVFVLTGEGSANIYDYANVGGTDASSKAIKKAYGTDKIVIANDKANAKGAAAQATLIGGSFNNGNLVLTVNGRGYLDSVSAAAYVTAKDKDGAKHSVGGYDSDTKFMTTTTASGKASVAGNFVQFDGANNTGTYTIYQATDRDEEVGTKNKITVVDQGITYTQDYYTLDYAKDSDVSVTGNYHTALNPFALKLDGAATKKAMRLVAVGGRQGAVTTSVNGENVTYTGGSFVASDVTLAGGTKADTLIAGTNASLNGGAGNDIFWVKSGNAVTIADFGGAQGKEKDKIYVDTTTQLSSLVYTNNNKDVQIGNITIANGVNYTTNGGIAFYQDSYTDVVKKGVITGTKKTTDAMIRTFGTNATIAAAGSGSTFFKTFSGEVDSSVMVVDVSKGKGVNLEIGSSHVVSIKGGAKNDTIGYDGTFAVADFAKNTGVKGFSDTSFADASYVTVTTGNGNDVITAGSQKLEITDFKATKATANRTTGAVTKITGDALYIASASASDVSVASAGLSNSYDSNGRRIQGNDKISVTFDGSNVIIGNIKLDKMKGSQAYIYTGKAADDTTEMGTTELAASNMATLNNLAEFVAKGNDYKNGKKVITGALGTNATANVYESDVYVIDASAVSGANIEAGKYVTKITGGKGVDTIYAGWGHNAGKANGTGNAITASETTITTGNGADFVVFDAANVAAGATYILADYSADKVNFNGLHITGATITDGSGEGDTVKAGKGSNAKTYYYSDVVVTAAFDNDSDKKITVKLQNQIETGGWKMTQVDSVSAKASAFALTYGQSDVTVAAADGNVIDLQGAGKDNKLNVNVGTSRTKAVTLKGGAVTGFGTTASTYTNILGTASKGAITYIAGTDTGNGVTFYGGNKADMYIGNKQSDVVVFSAGNNTVFGGGMGTSSITFGSGKETAYVKASDTFIVNSYSAGNDVFILDTVYGAAGGIQNATYTKGTGSVKDKVVLTFGTAADADTNATVTLENYTAGDKVTVKFSTAKNNKIDSSKGLVFQLGFGTDITYADADGTTIDANFVADATKVLAASNVKKSHTLTVGTNAKVETLQGGQGADTLIANYNVSYLEGGKGNDTFQITSDTAVTIADFNTGKDVLQFGSNVAASDFLSGIAKDYNSYYDIDSSNNVTLYYKGATYTTQTVVLKNATATNLVKNGVTTEININGTKVKLSDKVNVTLTSGADVSAGGDWTSTKTFDGSKNSKAVAGTFSSALTSYKGSKGNDTVTFDSTATVALSFTGGTDVYKNAGANVTTGLSNSAWVVTGVSNVSSSTGAEKATFTIKASTKANAADAGTVTFDNSGIAGSGNLTFSIGTHTVAGSTVGGGASGITGAGANAPNSDTYNTIVTYVTNEVAAKGFSGTFTWGTISTSTAYGNKVNFEERFDVDAADLISYGDTIYSGQEGDSPFAEITTAKVAVDVDSTAKTEVEDVIKGVTATFAGLGKQRQDK